MKKVVYIFLHLDDDVGYICDSLDQSKIEYKIIRSFEGESIPQLNDSMLGLVFMGGTMSVNDSIPWIREEIRLIGQAISAGLPIMGHCLGGQLISRALGAEVRKNPVAEIGWHNCKREPTASADYWLGDLEESFTMFHWHFETFDLPVGAHLLFTSDFCRNQAYVFGENVLAMQCHVEMTESILRDWTTNYRSDLSNTSDSEQNYIEIAENLKGKVSSLNEVADQLYGRWIKTLITSNDSVVGQS